MQHGGLLTGRVKLFTPAIINVVKFVLLLLLWIGLCPYTPCARRKQISCLGGCSRVVCHLVLLGFLALCAAAALHLICILSSAKPMWLWHSRVLRAELIALDAGTGKTLWTFQPPEFSRLSTVGDKEMLWLLMV